MSNILFFHIGNTGLGQREISSEGPHKFYHYFEKKLCTIQTDNAFAADYSDLEGLKNIITKLLPISQVFIITEMASVVWSLEQMKEILTKVLMVLKSVTFPLMLQKKGMVWLLCNQSQDAGGMALDLSVGLKTLIQVFAVEISKKNIVANFILSDSYEESLNEIILWAESSSNFNFTSQQLILKERN